MEDGEAETRDRNETRDDRQAAGCGEARYWGFRAPNVAIRTMMKIETAKIGRASSAYTRCSSTRGFSAIFGSWPDVVLWSLIAR